MKRAETLIIEWDRATIQYADTHMRTSAEIDVLKQRIEDILRSPNPHMTVSDSVLSGLWISDEIEPRKVA